MAQLRTQLAHLRQLAASAAFEPRQALRVSYRGFAGLLARAEAEAAQAAAEAAEAEAGAAAAAEAGPDEAEAAAARAAEAGAVDAEAAARVQLLEARLRTFARRRVRGDQGSRLHEP